MKEQSTVTLTIEELKTVVQEALRKHNVFTEEQTGMFLVPSTVISLAKKLLENKVVK